jgi:ribonuclease P protein component
MENTAHDADLQTTKQATDCQAWLPFAHGRPLGPGRFVAPPQEGAEASHGIHRLEARTHLTGDERFARSRRLVHASQARRVLTTGHRSRRAHLDIYWTSNDAGHPRLGLIVPKYQQTAVARNLLRRRLKELWRRDLQGRLPAWDVVLRTRREAYAASFDFLRTDLVTWCEASGS